jgi:hypothetical protein
MDSATTNLSEITCDFVRLWDAEALQHKDVRELFVHQASVVSPEAIGVQVGQEIDTELVYLAPTYEQVPSLKGLLEYIDARETGGTVNKYITNRRKHFTIQEGAVQQVRRELTVQAHRHEQLFLNEQHTTLKKESHLHTHKPQLYTTEQHTTLKKESHEHTHKPQLYTTEQHTTLKKESHLHTHKPQLCTTEHHTHRKQVRRVNRILLETFCPVQVVKHITNVRITRPIYIFTS